MVSSFEEKNGIIIVPIVEGDDPTDQNIVVPTGIDMFHLALKTDGIVRQNRRAGLAGTPLQPAKFVFTTAGKEIGELFLVLV